MDGQQLGSSSRATKGIQTMSNLSDKAMLVVLSIRQWSGEKDDSKATNEVCRQNGAADGSGKFRKMLLNKTALGAIRKLCGEMRNRHYELTLPWADDGARIITGAGFMRYRDEMQSFRVRIAELSDDFLTNYESYVADAQASLGSLFCAGDYPHNGALKRRFGIDIRFRPVPDQGDFRVSLSADEVSLIKEQIEADVQSSVSYAMGEVAERIKTAISHMSDRMKAYAQSADGSKVQNPFRDSLVENMKELVSILPSLNLTGDVRISELINDMKRELTQFSPIELRDSDQARRKTAQSADAILKKMESYGF